MSGFFTWQAILAFILGVVLAGSVKGAVGQVKSKVA